MAEKSKGGAGKFFLGALLGGLAGAVAGKFMSSKCDEDKDDECECGDDCECGDKGECKEKPETKKEPTGKKPIEKKTEKAE